MLTKISKPLLLLACVTVFIAGAFAVFADNSFLCTGDYSTSVFGNITVPAGSTCKLDRFNTINGNIKVEENASLIICPDNEITGNIKADDSDVIFISDELFVEPCSPPDPPKALGIAIGGNIDIKGANSFTLLGNPAGVTSVKGNVKVKDTRDVHIENFDGIEGNVDAKANGDVVITGNSIGGNLKIHGTTGSCTGDGSNNFVSGNVDACP